MSIKRDFSKEAIENLKEIIRKNVDDESEWGFVDWVHDFFMDDLDVNDYLNDIDTYHANMCDKHDISTEKFEEILDKLHIVDTNYAKRLNSISDGLGSFKEKINNVAQMIDPSAVTLNEHAYDDILDGVEKQYTTSLDDVKAALDADEQELKDAEDAYKEIPWYETAGYKTYDTVTTALDYADFIMHGLGKGLRDGGAAGMGAGGVIFVGSAAAEVSTAGGGTVVAAPGMVIGGGTFVLGGGCYLIGNVLYTATDGQLSGGSSSYENAKNGKNNDRNNAKGKASESASSLGNVSAGKSGSISDKAAKKIQKKWGKKGLDAFEKAKNKGMVGEQGQNGIKKLKGKPYKGKYTHEIKVLNGEYGDYRIFGYEDSSGNLIFDLFDKGLH